jgi:S1-C subfamily serine protease
MDLMKSTEGTNVIAIGSPNNKSNTATTGKVTATGRSFYESFTYTDLYDNAIIAPE